MSFSPKNESKRFAKHSMLTQHKIAIGLAALAVAIVVIVVPVVLLIGEGSATGRAIDSSTPPVSAFGLNFLNELSSGQTTASATKNFFISPLSLWHCLGMAVFGMNGATLTQSLSALRVDSKTKLIDEASRLSGPQEKGDIRIKMANYMLYKQNLAVKLSYKDVIQSTFRAPVVAVNAIRAQDVNDWFSNNTAGRIKDVVTDDDLQNIVMTLMNAVYFKANWTQQFNPTSTETNVDFNGGKSKVTMMKMRGQFRMYDALKEFKALALPYLNETVTSANLAAVIFLPNEGFTVAQTLSVLRSGSNYLQIATWLKESEPKSVNVHMPKFRLETKYTPETKSTLEKLGMELMFKDDGSADFSAMTDSEKLYVSFVTHQTFLNVDEVGTEAAAITLVGMAPTSGPIDTPIQFHVTRSFLFTIVNLDTQDLLFAGVINDPKT